MKLHVIGTNSANHLMHTVRESNGSWQSVFGNVNNVFSGGLPFPTTFNAIDSECVQHNNKLHVCILAENNRLFIGRRSSGGSWSEIEDLTATVANIPGLTAGYQFTRIACTRHTDRVQIFLLTSGGQIVHLSSMDTFQGPGWNIMIMGTDAQHGRVIDITAFSYVPTLVSRTRVILGTATELGRVVRYRYRCIEDENSHSVSLVSSGISTPQLWVNNATLNGLTRITGNICAGDEHFLACLDSGAVLHHKAGQQSFNNINPVNGNPGFQYRDVGCFDIDGRLHIGLVRNDGVPFHTFRRSNGNWQGYMGNINGQSSGSGVMRTIALG